ncbi:unnamed protein product [Arctia plantaginis]|uniref:DRBM domain-containing protein n=1 Tax=Arctia plantaginis TaxID=874455 RepID=A0A8S0YSN1_ARCPL|nr:unnamed protein product [Arctia plantaginis]CAB3235587.1 unnamed protein product [Arctia plantaginis]
MMIKMGNMPEYECVSQSGPQHQALFEYRCLACGEVVTAAARSKKEAKQEVARVMLHRLASKGHSVPAPFGLAVPATSFHEAGVTVGSPADTRSYVALLKELCEEYHLAGVQYELVGDTGPPHLRHFTMRARLGQHERLATSTTKKAARQLAAEKLYTYLRENLARVTKDFNEDEALARAHDKAMERYQDPCDEYPRRPDLGQKIADYHLGLASRLDPETKEAAVALLERERAREPHSPERIVAALSEALHLELSYGELARATGAELAVLQLAGTAPDLAFAGDDRAAAAAEALDYVHYALAHDVAPPALGP